MGTKSFEVKKKKGGRTGEEGLRLLGENAILMIFFALTLLNLSKKEPRIEAGCVQRN